MNKDWEKEFDENLAELPTYIREVDEWYEKHPDTLYSPEFCPESILELDPDKLKSFISNLLSTQRQEVIRRLEDVTPRKGKDEYSWFNDLLADLRENNI